MTTNRRNFIAGTVCSTAAYSNMSMFATVLRGQKVLQMGAKFFVPAGMYVHTQSAKAEPFTIIAMILAGLLIGNRERANIALDDQDAWTQRRVSDRDDFHDRNGSRNVVKPAYRRVDRFANGTTIDTRRDGSVDLAGLMNQGEFRKDLSEAEAGALLKDLAIFPKGERIAPAAVANGEARNHLEEAWRIMSGASPEKLGYVREFSNPDGRHQLLLMGRNKIGSVILPQQG